MPPLLPPAQRFTAADTGARSQHVAPRVRSGVARFGRPLHAVGACGSTGTVYWQANEVNARHQVTRETLGNGLETNRIIDAVTGWVSSITSGTAPNGTNVQNFAYLYNKVGSLTQRQDNRQSFTEDFEYDDLHRFNRSSKNGSATTTWTSTTTCSAGSRKRPI